MLFGRNWKTVKYWWLKRRLLKLTVLQINFCGYVGNAKFYHLVRSRLTSMMMILGGNLRSS